MGTGMGIGLKSDGSGLGQQWAWLCLSRHLYPVALLLTFPISCNCRCRTRLLRLSYQCQPVDFLGLWETKPNETKWTELSDIWHRQAAAASRSSYSYVKSGNFKNSEKKLNKFALVALCELNDTLYQLQSLARFYSIFISWYFIFEEISKWRHKCFQRILL